MKKSLKRTAAITMAASTVLTANSAMLNQSEAIDSREKMGVNDPSVKYKDGTYYGEAVGYSYSKEYENKVRTKVIIKDGRIESITLAEDEGNYRYPDTPTEGQGANGGPYKTIGSSIIKHLIEGNQNVYKIADDLLFWFYRLPPNATKDEKANLRKKKAELRELYYDDIGSATITARAISVGAANALDVAREASGKKVVTKIMMKNPPKSNVYIINRNNIKLNKSFIGGEVKLNEIDYEISYSDGTKKIVNYSQLSQEGFNVKYFDPESKKDIDITNSPILNIKKGAQVYTISVSSKYGSDNFPIVGVTPQYVEENLMYRVGEEGDFKEIPLNRENNKRHTYDVDEIVDRPSLTQNQSKLKLKKSDVGEKLYFKTTRFINPANNKAEGLEDKFQEFNYEPINIKRNMSNFEIKRRGSTTSKVPGATFAFGTFALSAIVEDDTKEQKDALRKIVDTVRAAKAEDSMPKEKKDKLKEAKDLLNNADKVLSEKKSSAATFKKTRVELEKKYNEYLNYGKEKPDPGKNPDTPTVANKEDLKKEIDKADAIKNDAKYKNDTKEDKEAFDNALSKAKEVYNTKDAKQNDVDMAKAKLVDAMSKLDGKEAEPGKDPDNPKPDPGKEPGGSDEETPEGYHRVEFKATDKAKINDGEKKLFFVKDESTLEEAKKDNKTNFAIPKYQVDDGYKAVNWIYISKDDKGKYLDGNEYRLDLSDYIKDETEPDTIYEDVIFELAVVKDIDAPYISTVKAGDKSVLVDFDEDIDGIVLTIPGKDPYVFEKQDDGSYKSGKYLQTTEEGEKLRIPVSNEVVLKDGETVKVKFLVKDNYNRRHETKEAQAVVGKETVKPTPDPGENPDKPNPKPTPKPNPKPTPGGGSSGGSYRSHTSVQKSDNQDEITGEIDFEAEALKDKRPVQTQRISGLNRFETSVNISKMTYDKADTVVLVNGYNNADALTAAPYANSLKAPILLIDKNSVPSVVKEEIKRLGAKNVVIIGGDGVVTNKAIQGLSGVKVDRIGGSSRYETSSIVAKKLMEKEPTNRIVLVGGAHTIDALSIPSMAKRYRGAVLLTKTNELGRDVDDFIEKNSIKEATIIGGNASISKAVEKDLASKKISIMRIAGKDRYETSKKLVEASLRERRLVGDKEVLVASGENFADALTVGPYAYKDKAMLLISKDGRQMDDTRDTIKRAGFKKITLVGGISSISDKLKTMFQFNR